MYRQRLSPVELVHETFFCCIKCLHSRGLWFLDSTPDLLQSTQEKKDRCKILQLGSSISFVCTLTHTIRRTKLKLFFKNQNFRKPDCEFLRVTELSWCPGQRMERPVLSAQSTSRFLLQALMIGWFSCYQVCFCTWVIGGRGWPCCCIEVIDDSKFIPLYCSGIESSLFHTTS